MSVTKFQLFSALAAKCGTPEAKIEINNEKFDSISSIEREDGSGHCFIVSGWKNGNFEISEFVRTID